MGKTELTEAASSAPEATSGISRAESGFPSRAGFRHVVGNICLALLFFVALIPAKSQYHSGIANDIWLAGAALMGVLSLVRVPPRSAMINVRSVLATAAMMVTPALMRPGAASTGLLANAAIVVEIIGVTFTQVSRLYLGRRFGLLPANRGIVSTGPFRLVRHPIYSGWLVLTIGFLMAYPTVRNIGMLLLSTPFLIWRIALEEEHLVQDPEYLAYTGTTRYRLIPRVY